MFRAFGRLLLLGLSFAILFGLAATSYLAKGLPSDTMTESASSSFIFTAAGDHGWSENTDASLSILASSGASFHLGLGDLSYTSDAVGWCNYFKDVFPNIEIIVGNHDDSDGSTLLDEYITACPFTLPTPLTGTYATEYYFDYPSSEPVARFILMAPGIGGTVNYDYSAGSSHYNWVDNAIDDARNNGIRWVIAGVHKVCITAGEKECEIGADIFNLLLSKRVDLILQGHEHHYQRSKQLTCAQIDTFLDSCVSGEGPNYASGAGSVIIIDGTFGQSLRPVNTLDPEYPYFVAVNDSDFGFTKYTVSLGRIDAQFVSSTGTFNDSFSIAGLEPVLDSIGNQVVDEEATLMFRATASGDSGGTLAFSLGDGAPEGAAITTDGVFTWTPTEIQGPGVFTVRIIVSEGALSDFEDIAITVNEVNKAPFLDPLGDRVIVEGVMLSFLVTADDPDEPGNVLRFSLDEDAPSGVSMDPVTGAFTWTPTEAEGPGTYPVTITVTDGHGASASQTFTMIIEEVNLPPALLVPEAQAISELSLLTFTVTATDPDIPFNTVTVLASDLPSGATFDPVTGVFQWTPNLEQGPATYTVRFAATDDGLPSLSDIKAVVITVNDCRGTLVLDPVDDHMIDEGSTVTFTVTGQTNGCSSLSLLTLTALNPPSGATFNSTPSVGEVAGVFSWTPTEDQGPAVYTMIMVLSDSLDSTVETITITVNEVNNPPTIAHYYQVDEGRLLSFMVAARDTDGPPQVLTFSLGPAAPLEASIDPDTGVFSWTPTEAQGPGTYWFTVLVSDGSLTAEQWISVMVQEVNEPPSLVIPGPQVVDENSALTFTVGVTDPDLPANTVTLVVEGLPEGAVFDPLTRTVSWTPSEVQGPGEYLIILSAFDDGLTSLSISDSVTILVAEVNQSPAIDAIADRQADEQMSLTFTAVGSDIDIPVQSLTYSLRAGAPSGVTIDPITGVFSWTPDEDQGPGTFSVDIIVSDGELTAVETVVIVIGEVNRAPVLGSTVDPVVDEENQVLIVFTVSDPDLPANSVTFSFGSDAPIGATLDPLTGLFTWTPSEAQGPGLYTLRIVVTDDGSPTLSNSLTVTITVLDVNRPPQLIVPGPQTVDEGTPVSFIIASSDPDIPEQTLTISMPSLPPGASFDPATGLFSWSPTEEHGPGDYTVVFQVSDGLFTGTETVLIRVNEVNEAPTLIVPDDRTVPEGTTLTFVVRAEDQDIPVNTITFQVTGLPEGATFDHLTGAFSWTPVETQGPGLFPISFTAADNGLPPLSTTKTVSVTVQEVNQAPILDVPESITVHNGSPLTFLVRATDPDVPSDTVTLSASGIPSHATFDPSTGIFSWDPASGQPRTYTLTFTAIDNGTPSLSVAKTVDINLVTGQELLCCKSQEIAYQPMEWLLPLGILGVASFSVGRAAGERVRRYRTTRHL